MAVRPVEIVLPLLVVTASAVITLPLAASVLALAREGHLRLDAGDAKLLGFTLMQALLSALLSLACAVPLARALHRRHFPLRRALVDILTAPLLFPTIVVVVALTAVWGRQGPVNQLLSALSLPEFSLFGLQGILMAHVFLNLPLALRMLLGGWAAVPAEHEMLAQNLRLSAWQHRLAVELPMLRRVVPQAFASIFLVCLTSFVVVLTLGGGPKNTSLELGIYQALRFDFDPSRAASLALLQFLVGGGAALLALKFGGGEGRPGLDRIAVTRPRGSLLDWPVIVALTVFLALPMILLLPALAGVFDLSGSVWWGALRALVIGLASAVVTLALGLPLAVWIAMERRGGGIANLIGTLPRAASPLALTTGLFLVLRAHVTVSDYALALAALINALLMVPFFLRIVVPVIHESHQRFHQLVTSLRLTPVQIILKIHLPRARREIAEGAGLAAALACGELAVLALISDPARVSLPLQVQALLGAYRVDQAMSAAALLTVMAVGLYAAIARLGGRSDA